MMYINTNSDNFIPKEFVIFNFYGTDTCFAWNDNEFIYFPYIYKNSTDKLKVYKAPSPIKDIRCFNKRIFILCVPNGIYKLTDNIEFANLSKAGIELGSDFCEVLTINDEILILEDKKLKVAVNLIPVSTKCDIHTLTLDYENTDTNFYKFFVTNEFGHLMNLCFVSYDNKLFKLFDKVINIIYSCDYLIKDIKSVEKHGKVIGIILQTYTNVAVFIHLVNNELMFDKIFLEVNAQTICAVIDVHNDDELIIIYCDGAKTYYIRKMLIQNSVPQIRIEGKNYESLRVFKSNLVIYLNNNKELFQTHIEQLRNLNNKNINEFVKLELKMLRGLDQIIEAICDKTTELKILKNNMIKKEDVLKRINLFVNKHTIKYSSDDYVKRILNQMFLVSNYQKILPENSTIVKMLKNKGKTVYSMKNVKDCDTVIEMPICLSNLSSKLSITTDLITYRSDGIWCLLKNYVQNPITSKSKKFYLTSDKLSFINHKIIVLKDLIQKNKLSMEELSRIKKDVREEIQL